MNSHNLESDISIRTVYTQQIMAQFHNFKPFQSQHNAIIGMRIFQLCPRLSCSISCRDCPPAWVSSTQIF